MARPITPKMLARAIGVSESSLKRWSDEGRLSAQRTVGGHRRIALAEAIRFIRSIGATVVRPDLLGLTDLVALPPDWPTRVSPDDVRKAFHDALENGRAQEVRAMVQSLYLGGWAPASIFDGPMREAMVEIGTLYLHAEWGIVVEHRATDICIQAVNQLRLLSPARDTAAPVAVGSAAEHDPYLLPSLMAAAVLGDCGFVDVNLGSITPPAVLLNAARHYKAKLVWISVSTAPDERRLINDLNNLATCLKEQGVHLVIGGRAASGIPPAQLPDVAIARSMAELAAFGRGVMASLKPAGSEDRPPDLRESRA